MNLFKNLFKQAGTTDAGTDAGGQQSATPPARLKAMPLVVAGVVAAAAAFVVLRPGGEEPKVDVAAATSPADASTDREAVTAGVVAALEHFGTANTFRGATIPLPARAALGNQGALVRAGSGADCVFVLIDIAARNVSEVLPDATGSICTDEHIAKDQAMFDFVDK